MTHALAANDIIINRPQIKLPVKSIDDRKLSIWLNSDHPRTCIHLT